MRQTKVCYLSSYDRGLDRLLAIWPQVLKAVPEATLDICYGWDLFVKGYHNNPERMAWKEKMDNLMTQDGITHHGRVGKHELEEIRKSCGVWAYPTYFEEINCITALECQNDGTVPVVTNYAALKETVGSGFKVDGDIYEQEVSDYYLECLIKAMTDKEWWEAESEKAKEFAKKYDWQIISKEWEVHFK